MKVMNFCKDCTHYQEYENDFISPRCQRTIISSSHLSLVSGITRIDLSRPDSCYGQRCWGFIISRIAGGCGKEGRFFTPIKKVENSK